eukprot:g3807.t1
MSSSFKVAAALLVGHLTGAARAQEASKGPEGGEALQQIKIEAPQITEEDQHGYNMPAMYMCNSCKAVMFHTNATFFAKVPKNGRKLKEWELEDVKEAACKADTYEGYGVKLLGGKNVLSGVALQQEEKELAGGEATIQMGGDNWKRRLGEVCKKIVQDELEEEDGKLSADLCYEKNYCGKEEGQNKKKKIAKRAKKEKKKEKTPVVNAQKKMSVDAYLTKLARTLQSEPARFTKARTEQQWADTFAQIPVMPGVTLAGLGKDEL